MRCGRLFINVCLTCWKYNRKEPYGAGLSCLNRAFGVKQLLELKSSYQLNKLQYIKYDTRLLTFGNSTVQ